VRNCAHFSAQEEAQRRMSAWTSSSNRAILLLASRERPERLIPAPAEGTSTLERSILMAPTLTTSSSSLVDASIRRVAVPVLVVLGYAAFILAGYNPFGWPFTPGNEALALPLYFYFALALLTFEVVIAQPGTIGLQIYVTLTSAFTLGFVANTAYFGAPSDLAHNPTTYLIINIAAAPVFLYGLITQQMTVSGRTAAGDAGAPGGYSRIATALTGLSLLGFLFWGLLAFVEEQLHVSVPISGLESIGITTLGDLDRDIALGALFLALVVIVIVGLFTGGQMFLTTLRSILGSAVEESGYALRFVLSPFIWIVPAVSLAIFSRQVTQTLVQAAANTTGPVWELFNPFSPASQSNYLAALTNLGLGVLAVFAVIIAVAVLEYSRPAIGRALQIIADTGRAVGVVLILFLLSLAVLNALLILTNVSTARPFQLGATSLVALVTAIILFALSSRENAPSAGSR
jgi:hypothetical protein